MTFIPNNLLKNNLYKDFSSVQGQNEFQFQNRGVVELMRNRKLAKIVTHVILILYNENSHEN